MAMKKRIYGPAIRPEPKPTPLDAKNLIKDQVLHWSQPGPNGQRAHAYVIIRAITDQTIEVAPVQPTRPETKCYDEGGADPKRDKDHVLLRYSSELFPEPNKQSVRGCYAIANNDAPAKIPVQNLSIFHIDDQGGIVIDERDSRELDDHPWRDELQRQKRPSLLDSVSTDAEPVLEPEPTRTRGRDISQRPLPAMPSEQADGPDDGPEY